MTSAPSWTNLDLMWSPELASRVLSAARASYPAECCGYLLGPREPADRVDEFVPLPNLATNKGGSPRDAFVVDPLHLARALEEGDRQGRPVKIFFHSHCDAPPDLSTKDLQTIRCPDGLLWPCAWLIVSVVRSEPTTWKLWGYEPLSRAMVEKNLTHDDADDPMDLRRR